MAAEIEKPITPKGEPACSDCQDFEYDEWTDGCHKLMDKPNCFRHKDLKCAK